MRIPRQLLALLATATLTVAAPVVAFAEPAQPASASESAPTQPAAPASDEDQYAAREARDESAAKFQGGDGYLYIGGGTVAVILIIILLVVLL